MTNEELYSKYIENNKSEHYLDLLIEKNMGVIKAFAKIFCTVYDDIEDFMQAGILGFIKGVERYDATKGCLLVTYVVPWIKMEIHKLTETRFDIRVPSHIQSKSNKRDARSIGIMEVALSTTVNSTDNSNQNAEGQHLWMSAKDSELDKVENMHLINTVVDSCNKLTDMQKSVISTKFNVDIPTTFKYRLDYVSAPRLRAIEHNSLMLLKKCAKTLDI
jgi:RNA polymerase sigma factor (sigma-70 family)